MKRTFLVLCRVNLILDKSGFKVLGKAFLSDFWFLVFGNFGIFVIFFVFVSLSILRVYLFFGFSFYHPVTLVRCPSFVPFFATRFSLFPYSTVKVFLALNPALNCIS